MGTWDELYQDKSNIPDYPQPEVIRFIQRLESTFPERPLFLWDHCCGGGRHSILGARRGHRLFASDESPTGIQHLQHWASDQKLDCTTAVADMTDNPWGEAIQFHGIVSWDAIHHNTLDRIRAVIRMLRRSLRPGGYLLASLISTKSDGYGHGQEIEPNTFIVDESLDSGVPHHFFDLDEVKALFTDWRVCILAELVATYLETEPGFYKNNPFPYTKWNILVQKTG